MTQEKQSELIKLALQRLQLASSYLNDRKITDELTKAITNEAELPGFENKNPKFGAFTNKEFVAMMTDIRNSTSIIMAEEGVVKMFKIFYVYSAVIANIVDSHKGTSTEFLGDGVLNLFDTDGGLDSALRNSIGASWDILDARENVLNPIFVQANLPAIDYGIGISHGTTIVTRFGFKGDNDLKAFGKCAYEVAKLCKGYNEIRISEKSQLAWPVAPGGRLVFTPQNSFSDTSYYIASQLLATHV